MNKMFSSSKDRRFVFRIIEILILISILKNSLQGQMNILNIVIIVLLLCNDVIREFIAYPYKYISCAISNGLLIYVAYANSMNLIEIYAILLVIEIILLNKRIIGMLIVINIIAYSVSSGIFQHGNMLFSLINALLNYGFSIIVALLFKNIVKEKAKTENLNEELKKTNLTLEQYAKKIEELTIEKERNRIAQELHDSIGHSLVALNMNLEYAENIVEIKPEKAKSTLENCKKLSKASLSSLRKVVNIMKENSSEYDLKNEIERLFENFKSTEEYEFKLEIDEGVKKLENNIKIVIFKIVREAITNGIKHGKATMFKINVSLHKEYISFKVENNGIGIKINDIVKSNGLKGMEERIKEVQGELLFNSSEEIGFIVDGRIPINASGGGKND